MIKKNSVHEYKGEVGHLGILSLIINTYRSFFGEYIKCVVELIEYDENDDMMKGILRVPKEQCVQIHSCLLMISVYQNLQCQFRNLKASQSLVSLGNSNYLLSF